MQPHAGEGAGIGGEEVDTFGACAAGRHHHSLAQAKLHLPRREVRDHRPWCALSLRHLPRDDHEVRFRGRCVGELVDAPAKTKHGAALNKRRQRRLRRHDLSQISSEQWPERFRIPLLSSAAPLFAARCRLIDRIQGVVAEHRAPKLARGPREWRLDAEPVDRSPHRTDDPTGHAPDRPTRTRSCAALRTV